MKPKALLNKVGLWSATAAASAALVIGIAPITAKALNIPTEVTEEGKIPTRNIVAPVMVRKGRETDLLPGRCFQNHVILQGVLISSEQPQAVHSPQMKICTEQFPMAYQILP